MSEAQALQRIQEIDIELLRNASMLQRMPQQEKLKTIRLARKKVASELSRIVGQRKDAQIDIEDCKADIEHYGRVRADVQAEAATGTFTHREVRDIEQQLTNLEKQIEKRRFELGPLGQKLDRLQLAEANAQKTAERLEQEEKAVQASFEQDSSAVRSRIVELDRERKQQAAQVSDEVMARYEAARKRFGGLAVETLVGNVPTTCRVKLQPSLFHDLAHGPRITECPYCHRILITAEEDGE